MHWKDWYWSWNSNTLATWCEELTHWKDPDAGKGWGQEEKGMTKDEMVGWHHQLNEHGFGWTLGVGDGQEGLACCSSWGCKESETTEWLNWTELNSPIIVVQSRQRHAQRQTPLIFEEKIRMTKRQNQEPREYCQERREFPPGLETQSRNF